LLELEPRGGAPDLGCGLGTLAIAAARLGWAPVVAGELAAVVEGYAAAGWVVADRREEDGWAAARLEPVRA